MSIIMHMFSTNTSMETGHILKWFKLCQRTKRHIKFHWRTLGYWSAFSGRNISPSRYQDNRHAAGGGTALGIVEVLRRRGLSVCFLQRFQQPGTGQQLHRCWTRGCLASKSQFQPCLHSKFYNQFGTTGTRHYSTDSQDTIFALSSGTGKCGVAVMRVSGPKTSHALLQITKSSRLPEAKVVSLTRLYNPADGEAVDKGLVVWFPGPQSFTGEDVCEFHVHGGPAVVTAMHSALDTIEGLRHAEPGEFTRRAFLNGKLDLTAVEGLGDLIHAETEAQRRQALRQMDGDLGKLYTAWRMQLLKCVAHVEAFIDFSEDENIEEGVLEQAQDGVSKLLRDIQDHLDDDRCGERLRSGVQVAIIGLPNVGKSSLLNLLCQRPAAIVTPLAGTTRDVIESAVNIGGYPVLLLDTAGLRETHDVVEQEGVRRARQRAKDADITIVMLEADNIITDTPQALSVDGLHGNNNNISSALEKQLQDTTNMTLDPTEGSSEDPGVDGGFQRDTLVVINKTDLLHRNADKIDELLESFVRKHNEDKTKERLSICVMSCKTKEGMDNFLEVLKGKVEALCGNPLVGNPSLTQARHRSNLKGCVAALEAFSKQEDLVMAAEQLRIALRHLGKITGSVGVEEILNVVFQDFCIGK